MRPVVATLLDALGALIAAGLIVGLAVLLFGCARPAPLPSETPAGESTLLAPSPTEECPGGMCALPKPTR